MVRSCISLCFDLHFPNENGEYLSCVYWTFVYILWIYSNLLPIFKLGCVFVLLYKSFIHSWCKSLIRYMICKHFFSQSVIIRIIFSIYNCVLKHKILKFLLNLIYLYFSLAFFCFWWHILKTIVLSKVMKSTPPMFSSKTLTALCLYLCLWIIF